MSKTPTNETTIFTSKEMLSPSPNRDQHGISKTVFSHMTKLHGLLKDWARMRDKGSRHFECFSMLKLHECNDDYYPSQLKGLMSNVVEIVDCLKDIVEGVNILKSQMQALVKLQGSNSPVISTWPISKISESVASIYDQLQKEYCLKCVVTVDVGFNSSMRRETKQEGYVCCDHTHSDDDSSFESKPLECYIMSIGDGNNFPSENIAHCRDEKLIEVYISSWELEPYFDYDSNAYLFAEVGIT